MFSPLRRDRLSTRIIFLAMLILSGCAAAGENASATADKTATSPVRSLLKAVDAVTDPGDPKDFVKQSRPPDSKLDYLPVGVKPEDRPLKPKTAAEVKAMEAQLDAARTAQQRAAGLPVIGPDGKPVPDAGSAKPKSPRLGRQKKEPTTN